MNKEKLDKLLCGSSKLVGSKQVLKGMSEGTVRCVVVASDADAELKRRLLKAAAANRIEALMYPSKRALGERAGVEVATAVVGITEASYRS